MSDYIYKKLFCLMALVAVTFVTLGAFDVGIGGAAYASEAEDDAKLLDDEQTPNILFAARSIGNTSRTRVIMDFDRSIKFKTSLLDNPKRIIIDLPKVFFKLPNSETALQQGIVKTFRYGAIGKNSSRIILNLKTPALIAEQQLQNLESDQRFRVILDLEAVDDEQFNNQLSSQVNEVPQPKDEKKNQQRLTQNSTQKSNGTFTEFIKDDRDDILIIIDAGHGGIDSGAKGKSLAEGSVIEKNITLSFSKILKQKLKKLKGVKALMTRETDEFVSLSKRVAFAQANQADLFISIHADSLREHYIRGASIYTLSKKASDRLAERLAQGENLVDSLSGEGDAPNIAAVNDILSDLTSRETKIFSHNFARIVLKQFKGKINLIKNPLRSAGFHVLKAPGVPSILLELGYLSNREDEKLLIDPKWQAKAADQLVKAIQQHLVQTKSLP